MLANLEKNKFYVPSNRDDQESNFYEYRPARQWSQSIQMTDDSEMLAFLKKMRSKNSEDRPTLKEVLDYLKDKYQAYALDDDFEKDYIAIQKIFYNEKLAEETRLRTIHQQINNASKQPDLTSDMRFFSSNAYSRAESRDFMQEHMDRLSVYQRPSF